MTRRLFTLAVDWQGGRAPTYESYRTWRTDEASARRWAERDAREFVGYRTALVDGSGRIVARFGGDPFRVHVAERRCEACQSLVDVVYDCHGWYCEKCREADAERESAES